MLLRLLLPESRLPPSRSFRGFLLLRCRVQVSVYLPMRFMISDGLAPFLLLPLLPSSSVFP